MWKKNGISSRTCGTFTNKINYAYVKRDIEPGFYQVPIIARRHLSKPVEFFR